MVNRNFDGGKKSMQVYTLRINFSPFIPGLKAGEFPAEIVKS
jgi:hypothetical protein